jgi:acyl-coenzyme A synthetase/AMP-(fatty) acid ligase
LLARVATVRTFLREAGLVRGDRVVLLASNSIDWAACDLAILSEALIQVPLYTRQNPQELTQMIEDCGERFDQHLLLGGKAVPTKELSDLWMGREEDLIETIRKLGSIIEFCDFLVALSDQFRPTHLPSQCRIIREQAMAPANGSLY